MPNVVGVILLELETKRTLFS